MGIAQTSVPHHESQEAAYMRGGGERLSDGSNSPRVLRTWSNVASLVADALHADEMLFAPINRRPALVMAHFNVGLVLMLNGAIRGLENACTPHRERSCSSAGAR